MNDKSRQLFKDIDIDHQRAEHYLLFASEERQNYLQSREDYISKYGEYNELDANPTERTVTRGAAYDALSRKYRWLRAVRLVEEVMSMEERIFLTARRRAAHERGRNPRGRPGWVVATQHKYFSLMEQEKRANTVKKFWLSESQVKRHWKEIITRTVEIFLRLS